MTAPTGRPPDPRDTAAPRWQAGGGAEADTWRDIQQQDMPLVCRTLTLPGGQVLQCRSAEPWTPARGLRLRAEAARRLPPLASGHRDPDGPRTDAPDRNWRPRDVDVWVLAARLADTADDDTEATG